MVQPNSRENIMEMAIMEIYILQGHRVYMGGLYLGWEKSRTNYSTIT